MKFNPRREIAEERIIAAVTIGATKKSAAKGAGINRRTLYRWLDDSPAFAEKFAKAWERGTKQRDYLLWLNHPFRGLRPPTGRGTRSKPRFTY